MPNSTPLLSEQWHDLQQQHRAQVAGMWIFLATELLLFGSLFTGFAAYLSLYHHAFEEASTHLEVLIAAINTLVLLTSSLTMALAVHAARLGNSRKVTLSLVLTIMLGIGFLSLKGYEYYLDFQHHLVPGSRFRPGEWLNRGVDPAHVQLFLSFYYIMTGAHAVHMIVGIGVLSTLGILAWRGRFSRGHYYPVEVGGLYWHFVDIVWIFLFPLLYLIGTHHKLL